ncbi:MAG: family 43 glycosylhydrolase [Bacteroidales bacterium]|nr:family 43 glycosylhydrolase [Bacteroidales bacterium]
MGSVLPEDSLYRNPVWEPDLSYPSVYSAAVGYFAIGADNEWSPGLFYTAPVLGSNDLMNWKLRGQAFVTKPSWSDKKITSISAGFAKTKGTYYIFYTLGEDGIGMGASKAPQGPFTDYGMLINASTTALSQTTNPLFFSVWF